MFEIEIGDEKFEVFPLTVAERTWYWMKIDEEAEKSLNPWLRLYQKVEALPANVQEIIFAGNPRKTLFPITAQERTWICCLPSMVQLLFQLATKVSAESIGELDDLDAIEIYNDLLGALGESYTGVEREHQRLEGGQAMAFLLEKIRRPMWR